MRLVDRDVHRPERHWRLEHQQVAKLNRRLGCGSHKSPVRDGLMKSERATNLKRIDLFRLPVAELPREFQIEIAKLNRARQQEIVPRLRVSARPDGDDQQAPQSPACETARQVSRRR